jgi:hypothetical protein
MTSGQSCARTKGSTRDKFIFRAGQGARKCRAQFAASSRAGLLSMRAGEGQLSVPASRFTALSCGCNSNDMALVAWRCDSPLLPLSSALSYRTPTRSHHHPPISPRPFCPSRARLSPSPARPRSSASSNRARTTPAAGATAASPPNRAASAPGCYSSTTSVPVRAAHQLHLRARPAGALATTAHLQTF